MPYVAFRLRMRAAAQRQLGRILAYQAAQSENVGLRPYVDALRQDMGVNPEPLFALKQSDG